MSERGWAQRLQRLDRRWIFLVMALAIVVPLYVPIRLPIVPSPMTRAAYDAIEQLHAGDRVFVSMDIDPASTAELEPYYRALVLQLKQKDIRIAFATLWYQAPPLVERWLRESLEQSVAGERRYVRDQDYVNLGFREGRVNMMLAMGADLPRAFDGRADDGTPLASIPWLADVHGLGDFKLLISISAVSPGAKEYVQYVQNRYALRMVVATTAVSTTDLAPYYQSGQLLGLVAGLSGAAEYETLVGRPSIGVEGANVLNVGHLVVILAIVLGNIAYFATRRRRAR